MLTIFDDSDRYRKTRRELLRIGTSTLGGISLASLFATQGQAASVGNAIKDRSVVILNLQGGPSQFETFDPKMTAPAEIRSITGETKTKIPGVTFGGTLPKLAALADKMAIVRSYRHGISSHGPAAMHVMAGGNPTGAMMGALFASVAGLTNSDTGIPQNVLVTPSVVGSQYKKLYHNVDRVSQTGTLSSVLKPFDSSAGGEVLDNMKLSLEGNRLDDRRSLLSELDRLKRQFNTSGALESANQFQQQAFDVLTRGVSAAFDLSQEDPQTLARYDTSAFEPTAAVKNRNSYAAQFSPVALGKQMLLARRLCEEGCGFVTVTCGGWDMHGGGKEFTMTDGLNSLTPAVDQAVSAFIEDVEQRGLSDKILLVITGEFGRTPKVNKNGGRDHWGNLCTLAFVGGGLRMGQVVGRSDKTASVPASDPISSKQVLATIMHTLFDIGEVRLLPSVSQELKRIITETQPIRELV